MTYSGLLKCVTTAAGRMGMAQKVQTLFIDDLDGSEAEGTVRFGLDGAHYEIDLNAVHARELRDTLARYTRAARKAGGTSRRPAKAPGKATANGLRQTALTSRTAAGSRQT